MRGWSYSKVQLEEKALALTSTKLWAQLVTLDKTGYSRDESRRIRNPLPYLGIYQVSASLGYIQLYPNIYIFGAVMYYLVDESCDETSRVK